MKPLHIYLNFYKYIYIKKRTGSKLLNSSVYLLENEGMNQECALTDG